MARLYVLSGPDLGKSFEVASGAVLGRAIECAIVLRDASVSRQHARIECADGQWSVLDLGSRNGLWLRGEKQPRLDLADGLEFKLGEVELRFRVPSATPTAPGTAAASPAPVAAAAPAASEPDEIELEGDWSAPDPKPAPRPSPASSAAPSAPSSPSAPPSRAPVLAPSAPTQIRPKPALAAAARGLEHHDRGVLQYSKVEDRPGAFQADLAQQPWYVKLGAWLLALALFAAVGYGAFRAAAFFKGKVAAPAEENEPPQAR